MPESFRVNLFRQVLPTENQNVNEEIIKKHQKDVGRTSEENYISDFQLNPLQNKIIEMLLLDPQMTAVKLAEKIGIASRSIERNIKICLNEKLNETFLVC